MRTRLSLALVLALSLSSTARAATFLITIKNTSGAMFAPGVFTLSPLLNVGPSPNPNAKQFWTYLYSKSDCAYADTYCPAGSNFTCWFANETTLMNRWGLTAGVDAFVPSPPSMIYGYHIFNPGDSATTVIQAQPGQKLSYITKAGDFNTYIDQVVMMHATGNAADLTIPLFDASGLPLSNIVFDLGGYTVDSKSAVSGTAGECAAQCPANSMGNTNGCFVSLGSTATGSLLPGQAALPFLTKQWTYQAPASYTTDGLAFGNLSAATAGNEIIVSMEGSAVMPYGTGVGHAAVLRSDTGASTSTFNGPVAGNDFLGFPTIENLNNPVSGTDHYFVSEFAALQPMAMPPKSASVYARNGDSTMKYTVNGFGYPGNWNMGLSAADLRTDAANPGNELLVTDYNGDIAVLNRVSAATLNTFNLFAAPNNDTIYGHAAIANVLTTAAYPGNEIVVYGGTTGKVYVFSTQAVTPSPLIQRWTSAAPLNGGYAFGSGPAIADLDGDGYPEVIVATGGSAGVFAYEPGSAAGLGPTTCKYKWTLPANLGFDYSWSSPVVGDVTGDGKLDVVVLSSDSILSVLTVPTAGAGCTEGGVALKYTVGNGGPAWFTPALANLTGTTALDIVVGNYQTLEVVDATRGGAVMRFNDFGAQFYPSALIEKGAGAAPAAIYVSGWQNGKVYKLTTSSGLPVPTTDWPGFMGANLRNGVPH